jgi:hypothetical protein
MTSTRQKTRSNSKATVLVEDVVVAIEYAEVNHLQALPEWILVPSMEL